MNEIFTREARTTSRAFFYAIGTAAGGLAGRLLFGSLIDSDSVGLVAVVFFIGAAVMGLFVIERRGLTRTRSSASV